GEGGKEDGGGELAVVEEVRRLFPVGVESYLETGDDDLGYPSIEVVGAFGPGGRILGHLRRRRRVSELIELGGGGEDQWGRGEVAGIAGVDRGHRRRRPHDIDARAGLIFVPEALRIVEPH